MRYIAIASLMAMSLDGDNSLLDPICKDPSGTWTRCVQMNVQRKESWNPSEREQSGDGKNEGFADQCVEEAYSEK
jgi:hypothetical protein